jgi:hypothetical protein
MATVVDFGHEAASLCHVERVTDIVIVGSGVGLRLRRAISKTFKPASRPMADNHSIDARLDVYHVSRSLWR